ncbi:MBL fold metallo-hydrolase [Paraliomyxa miuraensis]|uniref:MBL fold metallo-hydrolase n=1 Tax=Paraliomyxa miuraensis TaxID=376150 RepID=UPI00224CA4B8|nr:MBL fold metallo-hydrolase [Paraliomyxa miuraensis]MCX4242881.1 MBL fold metallo-hydrolase [Paraliomyxa miuraensis]
MSASSPSMTLRFFGAGGAFSRKYGTTCSGITLRNGHRWLIDCGRQAPDQLHAAGVSWHDIEGQIITHVHGDHTFGLEDFAFSRFFHSDRGIDSVRDGGPRPKLVCHRAVREEVWQTMAAALRYVPDPESPTSGRLETYFEVIEPSKVEPPAAMPWSRAEHFAVGGLRMVARDTEHVPGKPSTSLEIAVDEPGDATGSDSMVAPKIAWWSGDVTVMPDLLAELEPRTSVFFHDCTFTEYPGQVHGSFQALEALPEVIRRKIVLMHHEDDLEEHRARAEALGFRIALPGQVYDLVTGQRLE